MAIFPPGSSSLVISRPFGEQGWSLLERRLQRTTSLAKSETVVKRTSRAIDERERKEVICMTLEEKNDAFRDDFRKRQGT